MQIDVFLGLSQRGRLLGKVPTWKSLHPTELTQQLLENRPHMGECPELSLSLPSHGFLRGVTWWGLREAEYKVGERTNLTTTTPQHKGPGESPVCVLAPT